MLWGKKQNITPSMSASDVYTCIYTYIKDTLFAFHMVLIPLGKVWIQLFFFPTLSK